MRAETDQRSPALSDRVTIGVCVVVILLTIVSVVAMGGIIAVHLTAIAAAFMAGQAWSRKGKPSTT